MVLNQIYKEIYFLKCDILGDRFPNCLLKRPKMAFFWTEKGKFQHNYSFHLISKKIVSVQTVNFKLSKIAHNLFLT